MLAAMTDLPPPGRRPLNDRPDPADDRERIVGPMVRAVVAAPVALRAAGAAWVRHWQGLLAPALDAVGGEITSSAMHFSGASIEAVGADPLAAFQAIVAVLDASPEARDYLTRVELAGMDPPSENRSYQKRPPGAEPG